MSSDETIGCCSTGTLRLPSDPFLAGGSSRLHGQPRSFL